MRLMPKLISAGFATCALASASMPAFSWTVWPNPDFEWYANVGRPVTLAAPTIVEVEPAPREGYIWAPGRYVWTGTEHRWESGRWIKDDYHEQVAAAYNRSGSAVATGPTQLRDRDGNVIPTDPGAYPIDRR